MVPMETKSSLSSVPSNGTNPKASLETNTSVDAAKQASCEANNLVSTETKYDRKMIRSCGAKYASCEDGNLVSTETKFHRGQKCSCGAKLASCEAETLHGSFSRRAFTKAKYQTGTVSSGGNKYCKAPSVNEVQA